MLCPVCNDEEMLILEYNDVEIDYCNECSGIWLDEGELELLIGTLEKDAKKINEFKRFSIRYEPENFRTSKFDLRVRTQEDKTEIVLKLGNYDDPHRQEIPVPIKKEGFEILIVRVMEFPGENK